MKQNIIIAILCLILIAAVGGFLLSQPQATTEDGKINTQMNFLSADSLQNGQTVEFELKEVSGNPIAGEVVKISYVANGVTEKYSVVTDAHGHGYLVLSGEDAGSYDITLNYDGNAKYNACTAKQTLKIEETSSSVDSSQVKVESDANSTANTVLYNNASSQSASSSNSSNGTSTSEDPTHEFVANLYYDEVLGVYYDDFGVIHGGDMDGNEIAILRELYENPNTDEYGNPQWG